MRKGEFTRESILEKAYALAVANGFETLSYNGLAREVGIKPQSMYRYIENIDDLRSAIIARYLKDMNAGIEREIEAQSGREALRILAQCIYSQCQQADFREVFYALNAYKYVPDVSEQLYRLSTFSLNVIGEYTKEEAELIRRQQLYVGFIYGNTGMLASGLLPKTDIDQKHCFDMTMDQIIDLITAD